jgi:DNA replication and repair protein RecF
MSLVCGLKARNLRSIRRLDLALDAGLTVVTGANGAGKTTLIEALYLVARGRSFRGRRWGELTSVGEGSTASGGVSAPRGLWEGGRGLG